MTEWPLGVGASCWLLPQGPPARAPVGVVSLAPGVPAAPSWVRGWGVPWVWGFLLQGWGCPGSCSSVAAGDWGLWCSPGVMPTVGASPQCFQGVTVSCSQSKKSAVWCHQGQCSVTKGSVTACDTRQGAGPCPSLGYWGTGQESPQEGGRSHCHYIPSVPPEQQTMRFPDGGSSLDPGTPPGSFHHWGHPWGHPPSPIPSLSFPPQLTGFQVFSSFQSSASPKDGAPHLGNLSLVQEGVQVTQGQHGRATGHPSMIYLTVPWGWFYTKDKAAPWSHGSVTSLSPPWCDSGRGQKASRGPRGLGGPW